MAEEKKDKEPLVCVSDKDFEKIKTEVEGSGKGIHGIKEEIDELWDEIEDTGKDVDEIKEEITDTGKDVDEIKEEVEEIREEIEDTGKDVDEIKQGMHKLLKQMSSKLIPDEFAFDDVAQQIVGALILTAPLAVTEEVWNLSQHLDSTRMFLLLAITIGFDILMIYHTTYQQVKIRHVVPWRLLSLVIISYLTATTVLYLFGVIGYKVIGLEAVMKLVLFVGLFSNIGAATADILK